VTPVRLFVAVFPPPPARDAAAQVADELRSRGDHVAWVRRENLHVTMRFLGEVEPAGVGAIEDAVRATAAATAPFDAALGRAGAFPDAARARVLWLGLREGGAEMKALAAALEEALVSRGVGRADRPFSAHLTLGRVRDGADWGRRLAAVQPPEARFRVDELRLVESELSPGGSRFTMRVRAPLGG
jgi:2'-5' RNA ligase